MDYGRHQRIPGQIDNTSTPVKKKITPGTTPAPTDSFKPSVEKEKRGLVLLQIDGLSHKSLKKAMEEGHAPNIKSLLDAKGYAISPFQCGIATVTIPVLASLFYGVELPGNDWYDKATAQFVDGIEYETKLRQDLAQKGQEGILTQGATFSSPLSGGSKDTAMTVNPLKDSQKTRGTLATLIDEAKRDR